MKKIVFLFLIVININLFSQSKVTVVFPSKEEIEVKANPINTFQSNIYKIKGVELEFPSKPKNIIIDTSNLLLFILSKSSIPEYKVLYCYGIEQRKILWKVNTNADFVDKYDSLIYLTGPEREFMLDSKTGKMLWQNNYRLYHIGFNNRNLAVSLKTISSFEVIRPSSGETLFKQKTKNIHGINDVKFVNDSILLLAIDGIYRINLQTGSSNFVAMKTSKSGNNRFLGGNVLSENTTIISGYPLEYNIYGTYGVSGLSSNILIDNESIFLADNRSLYCLRNTNLSKIWTSQLINHKLGASRLYACDSVISLLNLGIARQLGTYLKYNQPYFTLFDKETGNSTAFVDINVKDGLRYLQEYENEILFETRSQILKFNYLGKLVDSLSFNSTQSDTIGEFVAIAKKNDFVFEFYKIDSSRVSKLDTFKYLVLTNKGLLITQDYLKDFSFFNYKALGSKIFENDKIIVVAGVDINKGFIFRKVLNIIYVVDKNNGNILERKQLNDAFEKDNYIINQDKKTIQIFELNNN